VRICAGLGDDWWVIWEILMIAKSEKALCQSKHNVEIDAEDRIIRVMMDA